MTPVLTWLGQAGFLIESGGARLLVDPFFSEHEGRRYPPLAVDEYGSAIDRVLVTHEHIDHLDPESLRGVAERSPGVGVIAPEPLGEMVAGLPFEGVRPGDRVEVPGGTVRVVPAVHALHPRDGYSTGGDPARFVGYVIETGGVAIYHGGDTIADQVVLDGLAGVHVDVALLPVNGRDFFREQRDLAGNLDARDAVALAAHCGAQILVPMHWDLFEGNTERAGAAADAADEADAPVHVLTLHRGRPWAVALP
ncbi:MAG TPA: MBL fold metallo-hydrolase [Thermoleophilaceae bacterium]|nr:MBL fold metallo-hydrolase [Thermoleophilaceae bacterium]